MTRTQAEMEATYDAERSGAAWLKVQQITDDPTDDGRDIPLSADEALVLDLVLSDEPENTDLIIAILGGGE